MMNVYNSLTRRVEELKPLEGNEIRLYTCGPTVYNFAHIGNFRAYAFEDILRRVVQFNGMKIRQVMNLTDVDDKTIRGANAAGVALTDYTKTYKDAFFADLKKLNIQPAEVYPAATDHIPEMIALVSKLVEKGVAYKAPDGSVYFSVRKFPGYHGGFPQAFLSLPFEHREQGRSSIQTKFFLGVKSTFPVLVQSYRDGNLRWNVARSWDQVESEAYEKWASSLKQVTPNEIVTANDCVYFEAGEGSYGIASRLSGGRVAVVWGYMSWPDLERTFFTASDRIFEARF